MVATAPATAGTWPGTLSIDEAMARRPSRPPDHEAENRALRELARALVAPNGNVLQRLVESAIGLCGAQSAGVSLIEMDGAEKIFRWHAVAGRWAGFLMGFMPRDASPCGIVVDRHAAQLMLSPELHFAAMRVADPPAVEALLVPFDVLGETVGTVWVISHDERTRFSSEDLRIVTSLSHFAAAAYFVRTTLDHSLEVRDELFRANERLKRANERLWEKVEDHAS
jgi:two-component system, cell cycle sensor histidine kinase and response regulator CckA